MPKHISIAQQINREASEKNIPLSVFIELTYRCSHDCYYCFQKEYPHTEELTTRQWSGVFKQLASAGTLYLTLSGGEPFIREDFLDILYEARKQHFALSIISNGWFIDNRIISGLAALGVMDVGISILAADEELHDTLTGQKNSFNRAVNAIRLLQESGIKVLVKHSVSRSNFGQYAEVEKLAQKYHCSFECDPIIHPMRKGEPSPFGLSDDQLVQFNQDMGLKATVFCGVDGEMNALHCDAGRSICGINPSGEVFPCIMLPLSIGNVLSSGIDDIWQGEKAAHFRKEELELDSACTGCADRMRCSRCHAVALMETGNWKGKAPSLCRRTSVFARKQQD